ncbi:PREDICTED: ABC transporter C family member 3 isoform X2 [Camelina sativa]|uniref:ABC-type xenobiotic transporter n=1 Tax=Camelina sativa TaxID=90675 RepID=A0ABM1RR26_CAMSA|nr:PREDICTED: ABC transporter C family member 3 isoform X1 [Camelina sativa]XP_019101464.1 PREDICTED: ABC transporter C family member 3 isoform X2 [Camelina sativa]
MDFRGSTTGNGMLAMLLSFSESILPPDPTSFLLKPLFLTWVSGFLHAVLLLLLFCSFVRDKIRGNNNNGYSAVTESLKDSRGFGFKSALFSSLALSLLNLVLMSLSGFYWYDSGWSDNDQLVSSLGFLLGLVSWGVLSICLHHCRGYEDKKAPFLLRIWLCFYLVVSCYSLVVDFVLYKRHETVSSHLLAYDVLAFSIALFLGYVAFFKKDRSNGNGVLEEPLLNGGDSSVVVGGGGVELNKTNGSGEATPYSRAGILSLLTFSWMSPLIEVGNKKTIDLEDVPQLHDNDSVVGLAPKFRSMLEAADEGQRSGVTTFKLIKALFFSAQWEILVTAFFAFIYTVASYVGPALIDTFVQYLNGRRLYNHEGYVLVITFFVAKFVECLSQRHWFFRLQKVGIRMRSALVAMIYDKGLTLSCQSKQGSTSGEIINFMTVDAERIGDFSWYMHDPWMVLLQVGLALWILYRNLGLASIAALVATILVMLVNFPFGRMQERFQEKLMEAKDSRMKSTSEILRNMRILKLQGWEMKFLSKIFELRKSEEGWLKKYVYNSAVISFVFWGAPTIVSVCTFGACILLGIPLESGKILSALATFRILQEPIYNLPDTISMLVQTKVSLDRLATYLCLDNLQPDIVERLPKGSSDMAVEVINSTLSWDVSSANPTLKDINFKISPGMKVAVCGTVGSGKSSLLSSLLGEVPKISGSLKVCGTKAFVAQSPWIQSGKIEDNILFGKPMERERYDKVLEACSLSKDLEILSFGDQTVIGERGINLSGGQKQRIQIARALYQDADIYLFDDPFSAVDAHTGSHLFKEVLLGLLSSKSVIYVTHQVEFLPAADLILVMKDGRISQAGKYSDILNSGTDFMELIGAHQEALAVVGSVDANSVSEKSVLGEENAAVRDALGFDGKQVCQDPKNDKVDSGEPQRQIVQEEEREKGSVSLDVYWKYITLAYGGALVPFILLAQTLFQLLQIGSNYWMAWATPVSKDVQAPVKLSTLMIVYVALAFGSSLCILARATLLVTAGYKTATELFHKMHHCIFRSPMSFFDSTPSGRIMSRASTDQSSVDLEIPYQFGSVAITVIQLIGIIGVMSQVSWMVFLVFIPVVAASIWLQRYYIAAARELSRLVGVCKAPLIQHFSETISGATTIRSFSQESRFRSDNMRLSDGYSRPKFYTAGAMEWLCFRLDMLSSLTFVFSLAFLVSIPTGVIDPSLAGLAVTYGLNLNTLQAWLIWTLCGLENKIISVERILQYASVPSEPPLVIESNRPEQSWPSRGEVDIRDLQVRYAPHMPLVLRGITCTFKGGLRTGIVGRTGSGKSTLIQTLFRIVEPSAGEIRIDGVNILNIGLHDLRLRLSIIPQDPTMFEGTVRSNLDPLEEYTDDQIWEALDKCQLGDEVRKKEQKLDSSVSENGENWSMGQRQLVCLGRVLLKRSKILVLDEATASVDTATDNLIQKTLREHFSDCTVITIAHRISSVIDSDMVLLLSNGSIEEYDTPVRLLEDKSSSFSKLVAEYTTRSSSSFE